jgi:hypothetical protein
MDRFLHGPMLVFARKKETRRRMAKPKRREFMAAAALALAPRASSRSDVRL